MTLAVWCLNPTHNPTLLPVCASVLTSVKDKRGGREGGRGREGKGSNPKSHIDGRGIERRNFNVLFIIVMYTTKKSLIKFQNT